MDLSMWIALNNIMSIDTGSETAVSGVCIIDHYTYSLQFVQLHYGMGVLSNSQLSYHLSHAEGTKLSIKIL